MSEVKDLEIYKCKRQKWLDAFAPGDRNSIFEQVHVMLWNAAIFNAINESRAMIPLDEHNEAKTNRMLHRFLDDGFFQSQFMRVRRLVDGSSPFEGRKGVWSLNSLLKDIMKNNQYLTRWNIICAEFKEYDPNVIATNRRKWSELQAQNGNNVARVPRELNDRPLEGRHQQLDALCRVEKVNRSKTDLLPLAIFQEQLDRIEKETKKIKEFTDKYIAHSATLESRTQAVAENINVTLRELREAYKAISQVSDFICNQIIGDPHSFELVHAQFDIWEYIDTPFITTTQISEIDGVWQQFKEEIKSWT